MHGRLKVVTNAQIDNAFFEPTHFKDRIPGLAITLIKLAQYSANRCFSRRPYYKTAESVRHCRPRCRARTRP